jgi:hypothetical protein
MGWGEGIVSGVWMLSTGRGYNPERITRACARAGEDVGPGLGRGVTANYSQMNLGWHGETASISIGLLDEF